MDDRTKAMLKAAAKALLRMLRFLAYVVLSVIARIVRPIAGFVTTCGLFVFLFCLFLRRDLVEPMWGAAGVAIGAGVFSAYYDELLRLVAPSGVVVVSEL